MKKGYGIFSTSILVVMLLIAYHYALRYFDTTTFRFFNYQVVITKCGPVFYDRVDTIEIKVDKLEKHK